MLDGINRRSHYSRACGLRRGFWRSRTKRVESGKSLLGGGHIAGGFTCAVAKDGWV